MKEKFQSPQSETEIQVLMATKFRMVTELHE